MSQLDNGYIGLYNVTLSPYKSRKWSRHGNTRKNGFWLIIAFVLNAKLKKNALLSKIQYPHNFEVYVEAVYGNDQTA